MNARRRVDAAERRARLALRHHLSPRARIDDVVTITDDLVGLHSSDPATPYLSVIARMRKPSLDALSRALYEERSLVRHHAMRRTLWVLTPDVARLAQASTTSALVAPERRRLLQLLAASEGIDDVDTWLDNARAETLRALADDGPMSARRLGQAVPSLRAPLRLAEGKSYGATVSAHTRVLTLLGFEGAVLRTRPRGSWINSEYEWAPVEAWLPGGLGGADATASAAELAHRWLRSFGPATAADLQWWTGWTATATKAAIGRADAVEVEVDDQPAFVAAGDDESVTLSEEWVTLLPGLDPTTMGWKQRGFYLDPEHARLVFDRNGNGGPTIWSDGQVVGSWVQRKNGEISYRVFTDVGRAKLDAIDAAAARVRELVGDVRFTVRFPAPIQRELL